MKALARSHVWWPELDRHLEDRVKSCTACQSVKQAPPKAPLHPWAWPTAPWKRIHVDFAGPIMGKMLFVITDAHSKWPEVCVMSTTTSAKTIVVSDNGPQFTSDEFRQFCQSNGVKHIRTSPYHPSSNGAAERLVGTVKQAIKKGHQRGVPLEQTLASFLLRYRTIPHATTGVAPIALCF